MRLVRKPQVLAVGSALLLTVMGILASKQPVTADLVAPRAADGRMALIVANLLREDHLLKRPLDDEVSRRGLKTILKQLDPMKLYFYQADIDEFLQSQDRLDDWIKNSDIKFAYKLFNRFLERVDERVAMVNGLLDNTGQLDFTKDEEMVTDPDVAVYSKSADEALDRWRKRVKYDLLVLKTEEVTGDEAVDRLRRRYTSYAKRMHQFSKDDLLEMYLSAVTTAFDPHTNYMSPSSLENFNIQMKLNLEGIGAALMMTDGYTVVSKIIPGGAADKHGKLQPEDRVISVGQGTEGEMVDVVDMNLNDVVKLIRGKAGTVVRLGVKPASSNEVETYAITRATIELKDSEARGEIIPMGQKPDGGEYRVGVIDLPSFYMDMAGAKRGLSDFKSTTRDVRRILDNFNSQGVDCVILDLSRNGGGSLTEAINLTGLFIDEGPVVQVKDADNRVQHYDDLERGMVWKGPLVVLTSKFSASASEIFAGAVQDYGRGIIVGDTATHGKGTVQSLLDLGSQLFDIPNPPNLGALKITMQQFYRPNGESTQKRGVLADVALPSLTTHMDVGESDLDYPVEFDRVDPARYSGYKMVDRNLVAELSGRSSTRRAGSEDFEKLERRIAQYKQQKSKDTVTLNEQRFFEERAEFDADKEDEEKLKEQVDSERPVFRRYYYNDEVLQIAVDYVELLKGVKVAVQ
ncbi:MAG: carboxy terminal-processing peptidase [Planctomycetales bacterium]|nr:carboxy terminal-processing peptidase [Planctomycetales bacterium]